MDIGDICTPDVVSADRKSTLQQAAALMREQHVGTLLVSENAFDRMNGKVR